MRSFYACLIFGGLVTAIANAGPLNDPFSRFPAAIHYFPLDADGLAAAGSPGFSAVGDLPTATPGVRGNGQAADGSGDHFIAADDCFEMTGENSKTISGWFRRPTGTAGTLMGTGNNAGDTGWRLRTTTADDLRFQASADGAPGFEIDKAIASGIADDTWFHVALVHDPVADEIRAFLGGALKLTILVDGGLDDPADQANIFWDGTGDELAGAADEIAVWDRVLEGGEIDRLRQGIQSHFFTRNYCPSGSAWVAGAPDESVVYDAVLANWIKGDPAHSWEMRIGKGGQIYSFITAAGETIPPQAQITGWDPSWWQDEVWQGVAVDSTDPEKDWFLHGSGPYADPPVFNVPLVTEFDKTARSYRVVHRMTQATNPDQPNHVILETRYRDTGKPGVIEVIQRFYNFGPELNFFNTPWGGVRKSSLGHHFTTDPSGRPTLNDAVFPSGLVNLDQTGGWAAWSGSAKGNSSTLAIVFGFDPSPLHANQRNKSQWQFGDNGQPTRDYVVGTLNRKVKLKKGEGLQVRFFFVVGANLKDVAVTIRSEGLVKAAHLHFFKF